MVILISNNYHNLASFLALNLQAGKTGNRHYAVQKL